MLLYKVDYKEVRCICMLYVFLRGSDMACLTE